VAAALERLPGVKKVDVSLEKAQARVEFDDAKTSSDKLVATIDLLGFRAKLLDVKPIS
jgi:copper chaperone CopZ